jgi:hypothetical protein
MGSVTERLFAALPAGTPEIRLSCLNFYFEGGALGNYRICHRKISLGNVTLPGQLIGAISPPGIAGRHLDTN